MYLLLAWVAVEARGFRGLQLPSQGVTAGTAAAGAAPPRYCLLWPAWSPAQQQCSGISRQLRSLLQVWSLQVLWGGMPEPLAS